MLRAVRLVRVGVEKHGQRSGDKAVLAQLLGRAGGMGGDGLRQHVEGRHGRARGSGHGHALSLRRHVLEVDAGDAAQFCHQPFKNNRADLAGQCHRQVAQRSRGSDALGDQLGLCRRADAPDFADGNAVHHIVPDLGDHQIADAPEDRVLLGRIVRQLVEGLCRRTASARMQGRRWRRRVI